MALELFSESWAAWPPASSPSGVASPRISFSRDLESPTIFDHHLHSHRSDSSLLDSSSPEFDFCVSRDRSDHDSSIADELFSGGVLLPLSLLPRRGNLFSSPSLPARATSVPTTSTGGSSSDRDRPHHASPPATTKPTKLAIEGKDDAKEINVDMRNGGGGAEEKPVAGKQSSSFWRFGRSSSLNYSGSSAGGACAGSGSGRRASLICALPLLSRSKSTGSNPCPSTLKQRRQPINNGALAATGGGGGGASSSNSNKLSRKGSGNGGAAARNSYYYGHHNPGGSGGVRISPVLNVPPPYIPKGGGASIFGLGHLLCNGKDRSRKKATASPTSP